MELIIDPEEEDVGPLDMELHSVYTDGRGEFGHKLFLYIRLTEKLGMNVTVGNIVGGVEVRTNVVEVAKYTIPKIKVLRIED